MPVTPSGTHRAAQLSAVLRSRDIDAFFSTSAVTMGYLAGYGEEGGERLLVLAIGANGKTRLLAPALALAQAERCGLEDVRVWSDGEDPLRLVADMARDWDFENGRVAVEDEMRASLLLALQKGLPNVRFEPGQPVVSELMRRKGPDEISLLRRAGEIADNALPPVLKELRPGMTELHVHEALTREMKAQGCTPNFCIVACGPHSAEPHHMTGESALREGDVVVMDYGCSVQGYMSDITRTVVLGAPTEEQSTVYSTVYEAFMAARAAVKPGVRAEDVDRAARRVIEQAGYGEFFVHRTGHGLGLRIHEEPYICAGNGHLLEPGNVFSIEPGIYLPGRFGVRIENIVTVTEDGHSSLNAEPSPTLLSVPV